MVFHRTYRIQEGRQIDGVFCLAFIHNWEYHLTPISVYHDGMIDCWGLVDLDGFREKVHSGWVVTQPPQGAQLSISLFGSFMATNASFFVEPDELIKDVVDQIEVLNGRPDSSVRCREAYGHFMESPSKDGKEVLRVAYEAMPEHKRQFVLGDMDIKDIAIRMILYGQGEIENWSHRQAARRLGVEPLPTITVPEIPDEA
ncbi:MAG: hypothetical protein QM758_27110 [Armatimonas sp.]